MKKILLVLAAMAVTSVVNAQVIWTNPITGTNPNTDNPYITGQIFNLNTTVSGIGRGAGAVGTNANDRYNANSWNTAALDTTAFFTFTLDANTGFDIDFTSFVYTGQTSATGPTSFAFRSSMDSFAADLGTPTATGATIILSAAAFQNLTAPTEFRLYGFGTTSATGTFSVNSFSFNGDVTVIPEPSTYALLGLGLGALWFLRRKKPAAKA